ncbi:MAG TPA: 3-deoxy-D-manno-octulosonic acid kinase [Steroidobacteraceae bacterium]|jgi:3-deoxy-D-manno-octulosonic acid kinase
MPEIVEQILTLPRGGIVYDASRLRKPDEQVFSRDYWASRGALDEVAGGRGAVLFLRTDSGSWVLRHYRRGGLIAKLSQDSYWWLGEERTRCFAEWRLLAELRRLALPVPAPVAARYVRSGPIYRADLITEQLPVSQTLAALLLKGSLTQQQWRAIGSTIGRFHSHGVQHADLNAHNILLGHDDVVYILDFDRGRIRARGAWEQRVLARLRRSLDKIKAQHAGVAFGEWEWEGLRKEADSGSDSG